MEIINYPRYQSICYHPSILPRHRGASSINWTLISGDKEAGLTIFWPDDGLDTGPILLQDKCDVLEDDTVDSLYKRFLYPAGVKAVAKAVDLIANGAAPREIQSEKGATYEAMLNKPELQEVSLQFYLTNCCKNKLSNNLFNCFLLIRLILIKVVVLCIIS